MRVGENVYYNLFEGPLKGPTQKGTNIYAKTVKKVLIVNL